MIVQQGFPQITAAFTGPDGRLNQAWYQLLIALWNRTGQGVGVDVAELQEAVQNLFAAFALSNEAPALSGLAEDISAVLSLVVGQVGPRPEADGAFPAVDAYSQPPDAPISWPQVSAIQSDGPIWMGVHAEPSAPPPLIAPAPQSPAPVAAITVGVSPYTYQATSRGSVVASGGTITAVEFSRDGTTWIAWPDFTVTVCGGDQVRITYAVLPTMTFIGT